jgi:membrane-bound toxin of toxin-antitoxin system
LSARYSTSPGLRLRIGESRHRAFLHAALCVITLCAVVAICARGYAPVALLLMPVALILLWQIRRDPMVGAELIYQQGVWHLQRGEIHCRIAPAKRSISAAAVIFLAFTEQPSGRAGHIWLFTDSASAQALRRLRVRLTLLR